MGNDRVFVGQAGRQNNQTCVLMEYQKLMGVILSRPNMLMAYRRMVRNGGAAGVDGVGVGQLAEHLRMHWPRVREELL